MAKRALSVFETVATYLDPVSVRNYASVVLSNGALIAATDGYGLVAVPSDKPAGTYRPSGEETSVKAPQFAMILDGLSTEKAREITGDEGLIAVLKGVSKTTKLFVGISRDDTSLMVLTSRPFGFGNRVWFSARLVKRWFPITGGSFRVTDDKLIATVGQFTHVLMAVTPDKK